MAPAAAAAVPTGAPGTISPTQPMTAAALAVPADAAPGAAGAVVGEEAFDRPYPYSADAVYANTNQANG